MNKRCTAESDCASESPQKKQCMQLDDTTSLLDEEFFNLLELDDKLDMDELLFNIDVDIFNLSEYTSASEDKPPRLYPVMPRRLYPATYDGIVPCFAADVIRELYTKHV